MLQIPGEPTRLLRLSLLAFAVWFTPLLALMMLEGIHRGAALFESGVATYTYLVVQGLLTVLALGLGLLTLLKGPTKNRLIVILPVAVLLLYAGMLIGGPG